MGVLLLAGCALFRGQKQEQPVAQPSRFFGTVAYVHETLGFVLIDTAARGEPAAGTALRSFRDGVETGTLTITAERKRPYVTADVTSGAPQKGDDVRE